MGLLSRISARSGAALLLTGLMAGCGGGGGGDDAGVRRVPMPLDTTCSATQFAPNHMGSTYRLYRLTHLPVVVYFHRDGGYTPEREGIARAGFSQWVEAVQHPLLTYVVTDDPGEANVAVRFVESLPGGSWGAFDLDFYRYDEVLNGGTINIAVGREATPARLQNTAAHEFGHALGMNVHTRDCADIMAGDFYCGFPQTPQPLSERDVNSLKTAYCWLFE